VSVVLCASACLPRMGFVPAGPLYLARYVSFPVFFGSMLFVTGVVGAALSAAFVALTRGAGMDGQPVALPAHVS
jgi:hypothetical protein